MEQQLEPTKQNNHFKNKLVPALTDEEIIRNIIFNVGNDAEADGGDGGDETGPVPLIVDTVTAVNVTQLQNSHSKQGTPRMRYFAVGPSTYRIKCPLCRQRGDAAVVRAAGYKDATCCLSMLSCLFPIFWICCICTWCGCNREWTTKGLYCSQCGGKLGVQRKPK